MQKPLINGQPTYLHDLLLIPLITDKISLHQRQVFLTFVFKSRGLIFCMILKSNSTLSSFLMKFRRFLDSPLLHNKGKEFSGQVTGHIFFYLAGFALML